MANQIVQITAGSGTNIQTFENTINSSVVEAQAVSLVDATGISIGTTTNPLQINDGDATGTTTITTNDLVVAAPAGDGTLRTGTSTAGSTAFVKCQGGDSAWTVLITGTWTGTLYFEASPDSTTGANGNWSNVNGRMSGILNTVLEGSTTINGMFRGNTSGITYMRVRSVGTMTGSAIVRLNISSGAGAVFLSSSIPAGTNTLGSVGLVSGAIPIVARADGTLKVIPDPFTLFSDTFETLDTVNNWIIGGTVPPTIIPGSISIAPGTTASASSYANTIPSFSPGTSSYLEYAAIIQIEAGVVTGNSRFWGMGILAPSPTPTLPLTDGVVFQILSSTGALVANVYSNGVQTQSVALTRPIDGLLHRYAIYFKTSKVYFEIDNVNVATINFPNPSISAFPIVQGSINAGSTVGSAPVLTISACGTGDTGRNVIKLADGQSPWRTASVIQSASGNGPTVAAGPTDSALVVAPSPNTVGPVSISDLALSIKTMLSTLAELLLALEPSSGRMRVVLDPLGGVQTLNTVTRLSQFGSGATDLTGTPGDIGMDNWAQCVRTRIT